ncbi:uncharacterized protein N0V89_008667 [Didymosphaeria variabile]|uniref:SH3 domain-containing protein n=1 Tax=Didymosphaeria variabile TaxID=1932322 RepID=A0A9W9C8R5_9PLEO|nr:uncharacterized protein N0V89_008667 [Didymosphaeria variabile]KAJ4350046.1 hypothetical protein N0V89_008667 [Didymosphaeria variabile]
MDLANPVMQIDVSAALTALEPLGLDQYCIAFGPGATQFCATPNGYSTTLLPRKVVKDLLGGQIKKVLYASFGSDVNSFFFTYQMKDGGVAHRAGRNLPKALRSFVDRVSASSKESASSLRVQLGANRSYVAWSGLLWVSKRIPKGLRTALFNISSTDFVEANGAPGVLQSGTLDNIAWHDSGNWYVKNRYDHLNNLVGRGARVLQGAWKDLWGNESSQGLLLPHCYAELAYVAINAHSPTGGTFAFFKKIRDGHEAEFILRFEPEDVVSRLHEKQDALPEMREETSRASGQVVSVPKNLEGLQVFQWAISKHTGRSHAKDSWELDLKKGERVKILKYFGNDWFFVENRRGENGWVHKAWLDFQQMIPHVDPQEAYTQFTVDVEKMLKAGNICSFPDLSRYMSACTKDACSPLKKDTHCLGICIHDLHELMCGSGEYDLDRLKMERHKWHPDKFARYCHPDHRDTLREKAQAVFVLFGVLMDILENPRAPEPAA